MPRTRYSKPEPKKTKTKPYKWTGEWHVYRRQTDGSEKRVHRGPIVLGLCSHLSKTEAQEELDKLIAKDRAPKDQKPKGEETFEWLVRQFLHEQKPIWEPETYQTNSSILRKHVLPTLGPCLITEIDRHMIQQCVNDLAAAGRSYSAVRKARLMIITVLTEAVEDGLITKNPARKIKMPKTPKPSKRFLTEDECTALLNACNGRDHLIIRMCMVQGLRPGEIFALKRDDVETGRIRIDESSREGRIKSTKTEASTGYVSLPDSLAVELHHWLAMTPADPKGLVFPSERAGHPIRQNNFRKRNLQAIAAAAGISGVTFQSLRRTTATHAQGIGTVKDAQAMLRHSSPEMTVGTYMQVLDESVRAAVEALDAKLCKPTVN